MPICIAGGEPKLKSESMSKSVIIVDDDNAILDVFEIVFARAGYKVALFSDGNQILLGKFEEPDVFIIDKQLRGVDGLDICRHLKHRTDHASTPVIIFSAGHRVDKLARLAGADEFLEKPFKTQTLLDLVSKHINAIS